MNADDFNSRRADSHPSDLDWPHHVGAVGRVLEAIDLKVRQRRRRLRQRWMSASVVAVVLAGGFAWHASSKLPAAAGRNAAAPSAVVSAPARQVLPDGSIVELNESGRIAIQFTAEARRVMLEAGEAHFQVTKDTRRPFVVRAGGVDVRAVGTAFSVQLGRDAVDVLVTEGRVAVDHPEVGAPAESARSRPTPRTLATLDAGNRITVDIAAATPAAAVVTAVSEEERMQRLAWRVPKLEFSATPLAEAVPLLNQYGRVTLEIGEASLGRVELSGILRADNLDTLFRLLARDHGIKAERVSENRVVLRRDPTHAADPARTPR